MSQVEEMLKEMGHALPAPPQPMANYIPGYRAGNLVFLSGAGPRSSGGTMTVGNRRGDRDGRGGRGAAAGYGRSTSLKRYPTPGSVKINCGFPWSVSSFFRSRRM